MPDHLWPQPTFTSPQWTAIISSDTIIYFSSIRFLHIFTTYILIWFIEIVSSILFLCDEYHVRYWFRLIEFIYTREYFSLFNTFFLMSRKVRCFIHCHLAVSVICKSGRLSVEDWFRYCSILERYCVLVLNMLYKMECWERRTMCLLLSQMFCSCVWTVKNINQVGSVNKLP